MQTTQRETPVRRITAAALKQATVDFLGASLPPGWISQPLPPASGADILVISPRGRCHFLFVKAPADRWWDGGPRIVPAEPFRAQEARLARRLRAAGHKARAIWGAGDLARAFDSWGCPLARPVRFALGDRPGPARRAAAKPSRATLHLSFPGGRDHG
jgi:hypothetical protein